MNGKQITLHPSASPAEEGPVAIRREMIPAIHATAAAGECRLTAGLLLVFGGANLVLAVLLRGRALPGASGAAGHMATWSLWVRSALAVGILVTSIRLLRYPRPALLVSAIVALLMAGLVNAPAAVLQAFLKPGIGYDMHMGGMPWAVLGTFQLVEAWRVWRRWRAFCAPAGEERDREVTLGLLAHVRRFAQQSEDLAAGRFAARIPRRGLLGMGVPKEGDVYLGQLLDSSIVLVRKVDAGEPLDCLLINRDAVRRARWKRTGDMSVRTHAGRRTIRLTAEGALAVKRWAGEGSPPGKSAGTSASDGGS